MAGWRAVTALARHRVVHRKAALQAARSAARSAATGISIRVATRHLGAATAKLWTLRVTGRRGRKRATVSRGRGWFGRDERKVAWYSAAPDQTRRHRRVLENLEGAADEEARHYRGRDQSLKALHRALNPVLRRLEQRPRPGLLAGLRLDVQEARFDPKNRQRELRYHYSLGPNALVGSFPVEAPDKTNKTPTYDVNHPAVAHLNPKDFGPYQLMSWDPTQMSTVRPKDLDKVAKSYFKVSPPVAWQAITQAGDAIRWEGCLEKTPYEPESYEWDDDYKTDPAVTPGFKRALDRNNKLVGQRVRWIRQRVLDAATSNTNEMTVGEICRRYDGRYPRATNLHQDERLGGHTIARHVLGTGGGVQDERDIAIRAAFEKIPGSTTPPAAPGPALFEKSDLKGGLVASAFRNEGAATRAAKTAREHLSKTWTTLPSTRNHLARTTDSIEFRINAPPADLVAYERRRPKPHPTGDLPAYVPYGPRRIKPAKGRRPLYEADRAASGASPRIQPLTNPVTLIGRVVVLVKATTAKGSGGWYILTMYPEG
jgi:hypothetical protein